MEVKGNLWIFSCASIPETGAGIKLTTGNCFDKIWIRDLVLN